MLILALVVFAVTAWFIGLRYGGIAAGVSFATLIAAQVIPGLALALLVYALHVAYIGGLVYFGPKVMRLRRAQKPGLTGDLGRWWRRGQALWKTRR